MIADVSDTIVDSCTVVSGGLIFQTGKMPKLNFSMISLVVLSYPKLFFSMVHFLYGFILADKIHPSLIFSKIPAHIPAIFSWKIGFIGHFPLDNNNSCWIKFSMIAFVVCLQDDLNHREK